MAPGMSRDDRNRTPDELGAGRLDEPVPRRRKPHQSGALLPLVAEERSDTCLWTAETSCVPEPDLDRNRLQPGAARELAANSPHRERDEPNGRSPSMTNSTPGRRQESEQNPRFSDRPRP
jgi:hypothetical protein